MRYGFTTGSCSAAAAKAAAFMLLSGKDLREITITTPAGIDFHAKLLDVKKSADHVSCGIEKDGGDDPDITSGAVVYAQVSLVKDDTAKKEAIGSKAGRVLIDGGEGVGRVTKPGLNQPVGEAAINSKPREMIEKEVREVMELLDYNESLSVTISVPGGEELAKKSFNPRFGIEGGISILGTTGIVWPMSTEALLETIRIELRQLKTLGYQTVVIAPGNYGMDFMKKTYGYDPDRAVKCSNFIGDTLDFASEAGFKKVLLCGHIGKMIKVAGGAMNTHSKYGDRRMELMSSIAKTAGVTEETAEKILDCVSTVSALEIIKSAGKITEFMDIVMKEIMYNLQKKVAGRLETECLVYSNEEGLLGASEGAEAVFKEIKGSDHEG